MNNAILLVLKLPQYDTIALKEETNEMILLANTLSYNVVDVHIQSKNKIDSSTYFGRGKIESLKSVLIFMDIRHPLKKLDMEMIALCENYTVPFILVLTKLDKVSRNVCLKTIKDVALKTKNENIFATSALKDMGFEALRKKLISIK